MTERAHAERLRVALGVLKLRLILRQSRWGLGMGRTMAGRAENAALMATGVDEFPKQTIVPCSGRWVET